MMLDTLDDIWMHFLRVSDTSELITALCCRCHRRRSFSHCFSPWQANDRGDLKHTQEHQEDASTILLNAHCLQQSLT